MPDLTLDEAPEASSFHDRTIVFFLASFGPTGRTFDSSGPGSGGKEWICFLAATGTVAPRSSGAAMKQLVRQRRKEARPAKVAKATSTPLAKG